jgi:hypothetical protein
VHHGQRVALARAPPCALIMASKEEPRDLALAALAAHLGASVRHASHSRDAELVCSGRRVAIEAVLVKPRRARDAGTAPPRLRFDRVVLRLFARLRDSLTVNMSRGDTVVLSVTAPIRLPARTAAALEEHVLELLSARSVRREVSASIHGNATRIRLLRGTPTVPPQVAGFVHNADSDPTVLFDLTEALLGSVAARLERSRSVLARRWLLVAVADGGRWLPTYGHVLGQLLLTKPFARVFLVGSDGTVLALGD